ncbi:hypothetical protein [Hwangdonia lutea]|uniref:Lipocalin-like domain-containing protein n=1 Tax=Hwangdonia lutea TaxID=3075823 RepID=A0AA97ENI6_9FLAO|nr:hypothetical protein [Hwangdonia sp. SCSIO 19198]WOD44211.1 hypothetical protein RNZ46_02860 [Hwangdonia sp. SCSIO 19198]
MFACDSNDNVIPDPDNLLIGSWVEPNYSEEQTVFKRAAALPDNGPGIMFKANGGFVERSSGWCGTPPLVYSDYNGNWVLENTLVTIAQEFYPINYAWRIVSVSETELIVKRELTEQEKDHQKLMDLYNEIYILSIGESCTNADNWLFTAYGAKACGGPQGYIAYSNQIDTDAFLQKVEAYNEAENAYNIKWDIVSTCDVPKQPKGVTCQNGVPMLIY